MSPPVPRADRLQPGMTGKLGPLLRQTMRVVRRQMKPVSMEASERQTLFQFKHQADADAWSCTSDNDIGGSSVAR